MPRPWKKTATRKTTKTTSRTFEPEEVVGSGGAELRSHAATGGSDAVPSFDLTMSGLSGNYEWFNFTDLNTTINLNRVDDVVGYAWQGQTANTLFRVWLYNYSTSGYWICRVYEYQDDNIVASWRIPDTGTDQPPSGGLWEWVAGLATRINSTMSLIKTGGRKFTRTTSRKYVPGADVVVPVEHNAVMYMRMRFSYPRISLQIHKIF